MKICQRHQFFFSNLSQARFHLVLFVFCSSGLPKPQISADLSVITVKDQVELRCVLPGPYSPCRFNSSSQSSPLSPVQKGREGLCTVTVSGAVLLVPNAAFKTHTHISCGYTWNDTTIFSDNITLSVFNFGELFFLFPYSIACLFMLVQTCFLCRHIEINHTHLQYSVSDCKVQYAMFQQLCPVSDTFFCLFNTE